LAVYTGVGNLEELIGRKKIRYRIVVPVIVGVEK
jgi:hypothetical protein